MFLSTQDSLKKINLNKPGEVKIIAEYKSPLPISRLITNNKDVLFGGNMGIGVIHTHSCKTEVLTNQPLYNRFAFTATDSTVFFSNKGHLLSLKIVRPNVKPN
jgi:hypothetical protein